MKTAKRTPPAKRTPQAKRTPPAKLQQNVNVKSPQNAKKNHRSNLIKIPLHGNRFDTKNPSTSFDDRSSAAAKSSTTETESKRDAKKKLVIKYDMKEKLFKEKPELFEKRMIIIDGSNMARSYVFKYRITSHTMQTFFVNKNIWYSTFFYFVF